MIFQLRDLGLSDMPRLKKWLAVDARPMDLSPLVDMPRLKKWLAVDGG
jgi:hypothetical protein